MAFTPILTPSPTPIPSEYLRQVRGSFRAIVLRDQFTLPTLFAIGAALQCLLMAFLPLRVAMLPALAYLGLTILGTVAQSTGLTKNTYMENVIQGRKMTAQIPGPGGRFGDKPSSESVVVLLLGVRINHPMGILAPNAKKIGDYFIEMAKTLEKESEKYGMLGNSVWLGGGDRATSNGMMYLFYFKDVESVHKFAHDPLHRSGWDWWNKTVKQGTSGHIAIWHEVFAVPAGSWESIYVNSHPTAIGATRFRVPAEKPGAPDIWVNPLVEAKGVLRSSAGRMARSRGDDLEKYGDEPY